jgi:hypothetical protein
VYWGAAEQKTRLRIQATPSASSGKPDSVAPDFSGGVIVLINATK